MRLTQSTTTAAAMAALDSGRFVIAHLNDFGEEATADTLIVVELDVLEADGSPSNSGLEREIAFAARTDDTQSAADTAGRAVRGRLLSVSAAGFSRDEWRETEAPEDVALRRR